MKEWGIEGKRKCQTRSTISRAIGVSNKNKTSNIKQ
jgi:hypothetical protein